MKILSWDVNHRAARRPIPPWLGLAIAGENPDALVLTEYVVGPDHDRFVGELAAAGLTHTRFSERVGRSNQLLIAARSRLSLGTLRPSSVHDSLPPNFLHSMMEDGRLDLVGFRMPSFEAPDRSEKRPAWNWLIAALATLLKRPAIIIGDFNTAVGDAESTCGDCLETLTRQGWVPAIPSSGYSWRAPRANVGRQIDLAFLSPEVGPHSVSYSWAFRQLSPEADAMHVGRPDHAMLLLEI